MAEQFQNLVTITRGASNITISLNAQTGDLHLGGEGVDGDIILRSTTGQNRIRLDANGGNGWFGGNGADGDLVLFPSGGNNSTTSQGTIHLDGQVADVRIGGGGAEGDIVMKSNTGQNRIRLDAAQANGWFGGNGADGDLVLFPSGGNNSTTSQGTIHLDGQAADVRIGGGGSEGDIVMKNGAGQDRIRLDANGANGWFGGNGADGDLVLFAAGGNNTSSNQATIHLDGGSGDIILRNADFAEDFDIAVAQRAKVEPGSVMVLDPLGNLVECTKGYDKKVTGVISGAGQYKPGIIMDKQENSENRMPVSLTGKVMCKVDTKYGAIEAGDLLTTSPTEGYAMKASDSFKSVGAIIGKALKPFKEGKGMLPILVSMH